jgi:hypothetical protein
MNLLTIASEAGKGNIRQNMKRLLRRYWGYRIYYKPYIDSLRRQYQHVYCDFKYSDDGEETEVFYIWVIWWQGEENMSESVRLTYQSIVEHSEGCRLVLITEKNYQDYVALPECIERKFAEGQITITHLTDILRFKLLYNYGGIYLDATTLITNKRLLEFKNSFFTLKFKTNAQSTPAAGRWSGPIMCGKKHNPFFLMMDNLFETYWLNKTYLEKYLLIDYFILLLYIDLPWTKQMIDDVAFSKSSFRLKNLINREFKVLEWEELVNDTHFHVLSRKAKYITHTPNGKLTYYGYLLNKYHVCNAVKVLN